MRGETVYSLLWEADPDRFARRYPDSGVVESWGSGWPPPCIDFWALVKTDVPCAVLESGGWGNDEIIVELTGDGLSDGYAIGREFARILRVAEPTQITNM